jgi:hypothetical protein
MQQEDVPVNSRTVILFQMLLALLLSGCATHELVLSRTLAPVLSSEEVNSPVTLFRARVQMDRLEVWGRVKRNDDDYKINFDMEIETTAALLASLMKNELTFKNDWRQLVLELWHECGSTLRWKSTLGYTKVRISRETMLELRTRNLPASEYPKFWRLYVHKVGPPDYVGYEWSSTDVKPNLGK